MSSASTRARALRNLERAVLEQPAELDWTPPADERRRPALAPDEQPPVRYVKAPDGVSIAYQVGGDGPVDLIIILGFTSHLDVWWEPWSGRLARRLMSFVRLIVFDKRKTGLSDRPPHSGIEQWMEDTRLVLDAVGSERAVVLGMSAGGGVGALFAATYPERTRALILYGASARYQADDDYPIGTPIATLEPLVKRLEAEWGNGALLDRFCPSVKNDPVLRKHYARFQQLSASPGAAAAYARGAPPDRRSRPSRGQRAHPRPARDPGRDRSGGASAVHGGPDPERQDGGIRQRRPSDLADRRSRLHGQRDSRLRARRCAERPDRARPRHRPRRRRHAEAAQDDVARLVDRYRGTVVRRDDGLLATFDGPARAIRCAEEIVAQLSDGDTVRAGLHCGECELVGREVSGVAVQIARCVMGVAPPGRVVVSQTVRDLVFGSEITFADHGTHALGDSRGDWRTYLVTAPAI